MPYLNLDDKFAWHRKTVAAGNAAIGVWARCGSWASGQPVDGLVPFEIARAIGKPTEIAALVKAGLWEETPDGYQMHDYTDHNLSAAQWRALSEKRAEAGSKGGRSGRRGGLRRIDGEASA
jgi:hypothetical protein